MCWLPVISRIKETAITLAVTSPAAPKKTCLLGGYNISLSVWQTRCGPIFLGSQTAKEMYFPCPVFLVDFADGFPPWAISFMVSRLELFTWLSTALKVI